MENDNRVEAEESQDLDKSQKPKRAASSTGGSKRRSLKNKARKATQKKPAKSKSEGRKRTVRSFPACAFNDALEIANGIHQFASGEKVRRLTLLDHLKKSADSSATRQLITNSSRYGLTKGSYVAEYLELEPLGRTATNPEATERERLQAQFALAIENIPPFKALYDYLVDKRLPAQSVLRDFLIENGYKEDEVAECVDTFIVNAKQLGLLRNIAGAERLVPFSQVLEEKAGSAQSKSISGSDSLPSSNGSNGVPAAVISSDWDKVCFYITPIGDPGSEARQHSDLFLGSIVEPAMEEFGLKVVRADQIGKPGMITKQVIEHVVKSRLVIADLSFHNPNVFYELSLRHACGLPTVQITRSDYRIPFDIDQFRTIQIDTSSIYTLVPSLEVYKAEIANQVRRALNDMDSFDNPLTVFCPGLKMVIPT